MQGDLLLEKNIVFSRGSCNSQQQQPPPLRNNEGPQQQSTVVRCRNYKPSLSLIAGIVQLSPTLMTEIFQSTADQTYPRDTTRNLAGQSPKLCFVVPQHLGIMTRDVYENLIVYFVVVMIVIKALLAIYEISQRYIYIIV